MDVSIIIPVRNGLKWLDNCMKSVANQTIISDLKLEIVVFNDGSSDNTKDVLQRWKKYFENIGVGFKITGSPTSLGVGAARNRAVRNSSGEYLCFQDVDDVMRPDRIRLQYAAAVANRSALIGSQISRTPEGSTTRFVRWANKLDQSLLNIQIYTSNGPTLLMPTWFFHKSVFDKVGGFDESGEGTPEDLIFFYKHLDAGGSLLRIEEDLLLYTYHEGATTFSVSSERIWQIQLNRIEKVILPKWDKFTIWNAGKAGRRLVRALSEQSRFKILAFCDVDKSKIGRNIDLYCPMRRANIISLPVIHFSEAKPPLLICVKFDLTGGNFEKNLMSLNFREGEDYIIFN